MTLNQLRTMSTVELITWADSAPTQEERNIMIFELTCRMYVPFSGVSFDELLLSNGYKPIERESIRQKRKIK
jgi:hypothetical protein